MAALNKTAASFTPKWLTASAPAATQVVNGENPSVVPAAAAATKLSGTATEFVPRAARAVPAVAVSPQQPTAPPQQRPSSSNDITGGAPAQPQGAWKARPPTAPVVKSASPIVVPAAAVKTVSPAAKPVTPGTAPLYRSPSHRPTPLTAAMEAAKKATLKKEAPSFVPKSFVAPPPLNMITPPVTPPTAPAIPSNAIMPLNRCWSLYFVDRAPQGTAAYDPTLVYDIKSVEDFWRTINNVPSLTHGNTGSTYYFFRDKIQPKWEDEHNKLGGSWTVRLFSSRDLTSEAIDEIWDRLLCKAIGESWAPVLQDNLVGLVAKLRDRCITIQFWVTRCVEEFPKEVSAIISAFYKAYKIEYLSHEAAKVAADEREKQEKQKAKEATKKQKKRH